MNSILLLWYCHGEYEDRSETVIAASADRAKLEEERKRHEGRQKRLKEWHDKYRDFWRQYKEDHPSPPFPHLERAPRWKAGLRKEDITAEMRAEREAVESRNAEKTAAYDDENAAYWEVESKAELAFLDELGVPEEDRDVVLHHGVPDEYNYAIEENVPWLE